MSAPGRGPAGSWQYLLHWAGGEVATGASLAGMPVSETAAARLITSERGTDGLHYTATSQVWHFWNGRYHEPDASGLAGHAVIDFGTRMNTAIGHAKQAVAIEADAQLPPGSSEAAYAQARAQAWEPWKGAEKYAASLLKAPGQNALLTVLARDRAVADEYLAERNPGLLNLANGTLDLASLELRPHNRADLITYALADPWDAAAACPRFWQLLWGVSGKSMEVAEYLVKLLGYCLLGDNREQKIIFIAGPSGSGKSVLLHVVSEVLGPLAHASGAELITVVRTGRNARKENSVRGIRLATITETSKFMTIDEGQLKRITGEPVISVDQHYAKTEIKTPVTWTIVVATNDMPNLVNFDAAMKRRIIVVPAGAGLQEWQMDNRMAAKILSTERRGVLAMLARGCRQYFRDGGLEMPWEVREATEMYASEQNTVASFVQDTMVLGGWSAEEGIPQHQAWEMYELWSRGGPRLGRNEFMQYMGAYPGISWVKSSRRFVGAAWSSDWAVKIRLAVHRCIRETFIF